jgi:hypothetical protein
MIKKEPLRFLWFWKSEGGHYFFHPRYLTDFYNQQILTDDNNFPVPDLIEQV